MNRVCLPPKRFESFEDARFDSIRHQSWFWRLEKRRAKIPLLRQALESMVSDGLSQVDAAKKWGVDERELRDYKSFVDNESRYDGQRFDLEHERRTFQKILDLSYEKYCAFGGRFSIKKMIDAECQMWNVDSRRVFEVWDVDPTFYPTGYLQ